MHFVHFWEISLKLKHTQLFECSGEVTGAKQMLLTNFNWTHYSASSFCNRGLHVEINQHYSRIYHLGNNSTFDLKVHSKVQETERKKPSKNLFYDLITINCTLNAHYFPNICDPFIIGSSQRFFWKDCSMATIALKFSGSSAFSWTPYTMAEIFCHKLSTRQMPYFRLALLK